MVRFYRLIACLLLTVVFSSESFAYDESSPIHFGARVRYDMTTSRTVKELSGWGPGFSAGVTFTVPFCKVLYFNPALMIGYETTKLDGIGGTEKFPVHFKGHLSMVGLRIPLDLGVRLFEVKNVRVSLYTGPHFFVNFNVIGKYTEGKPDSNVIYKRHNESVDQFHCMEVDWGVGLAGELNRRWRLNVETNIGLSEFARIMNIYPGEYALFRRLGISVGLGYNF